MTLARGASAAGYCSEKTQVAIESDGWRLVGDLRLPGSTSSGIPWLYVRSRDEIRVTEVTEAVQRNSRAEIWIVPGSAHGSDLVLGPSDLSERVAVWLAARLGS